MASLATNNAEINKALQLEVKQRTLVDETCKTAQTENAKLRATIAQMEAQIQQLRKSKLEELQLQEEVMS